jgi:hypothetical protein
MEVMEPPADCRFGEVLLPYRWHHLIELPSCGRKGTLPALPASILSLGVRIQHMNLAGAKQEGLSAGD